MGQEEDIVAALGEPAFYPHRPGRVEHLQTHISHVFLAAPYVYKLKKAVRFSFLDFSTPALRYHFCEEEVRLNRRLSPSVYLGVVPITREAGGRLRLGGSGEVVDHVVRMRRLPADRMLANLIARGASCSDRMDPLALRLAAFHAAAPGGPEVSLHADPERLVSRWKSILDGAAPFAGALLAPEDHEVLADFGPTFVRTHETLLRARQRAGRIREGHGDLHAEHVCFVDAPIEAEGEEAPLEPGIHVFDCIEFSRALRCNDVAYEIAFLAMDLDSLDRPDLARRLVTAYVAAADDPEVPLLVPFYGAQLASVRGMVEGLKSREAEVEPADREAAAARARRHFALALRYAWTAGGPAVIACAGLSGTGKTTLATELARTTGFDLLGTDVLRKRRAGLAPEASARAAFGAGLYTDEARTATYAALVAEVEAALETGRGVVVDGTFIRRADRDRLATAARRQRRECVFVSCRADEQAVRARLAAREEGRSVSDARWTTYVAQRERCEPFGADEGHLVVDTGGEPAAARGTALRAQWRWRQGRSARPRASSGGVTAPPSA
jgi:aminoglycoside phosphotransferase family enzyme/predicted kinase